MSDQTHDDAATPTMHNRRTHALLGWTRSDRWLLLGVGALIAALLVPLAGALGAAIVLALVGAVLFVTEPDLLAATLVAVLAVLSLGANNVPVLGVPLVLMIGAALSVRFASSIAAFTRAPGGRAITVAWGFLLIVTLWRLSIDYAAYGRESIRDALFVFEIPFVLVGFSIARKRPQAIASGLLFIAWITTIWALFFPFSETLQELSPQIGIDSPTALAQWQTVQVTAPFAIFYFASRHGLTRYVGTTLALIGMMIYQARGAYVATALILVWLLTFTLIQKRSAIRSAQRVGITFALIAVLGLAIVAVLPDMPGRVQVVSLETTIQQIGTIAGGSGPSAGSISDRQEWWSDLTRTLRSDAGIAVAGDGLGSDLVDGFVSSEGTLVRKPHNDYLETAYRLGIPALLAFLTLIAVPLWRAAQASARGNQAGLIVAALLIPTLVTAFFQPWFAFSYGALPFWFVVGATIGSRDLEWAR